MTRTNLIDNLWLERRPDNDIMMMLHCPICLASLIINELAGDGVRSSNVSMFNRGSRQLEHRLCEDHLAYIGDTIIPQ